MTHPTKALKRIYGGITKTGRWCWRENNKDHESYLYLAGEHIATVRVAKFGPGFDILCPGSLIASRKNLSTAKRVAVDATMAWLHEASLAACPYPEKDKRDLP